MLSLGNKLTLNTQPIYKFVNKYSIDFDGVDDRIVTDGADTVLQNTTYSFWAKTSRTTRNTVFGHGDYFIGSFFFNFNSDKPIVRIGTDKYVFFTDIPQQEDGEWHHWVVYLDSNNITNSKLYCDSVAQPQTANSNIGVTSPYTDSLTIGSDQPTGSTQPTFEGQIDEFAVYDRELTQDEITRMYNTYYSPNRVANGNFSQIGNEEVTNGDFSQIGSEQVTNGDFATDSDWTKGGGITISGGSANFTGVANANINQNAGLITGKIYKIVFTVSNYVSGDIDYNVGGSTRQGAISSNGTYTDYVESSTGNLLYFQSDQTNGFVGSIDNVSVKEVGQDFIFGTGWSMGDGKAVCDGSQTGNTSLQQSGVALSGKIYKIQFDLIVDAGFINYVNLGGWIDNTNLTTTDTYTYYTTTTTNTDNLGIAGDSNFVGSIDNISVKEVGQHWTFGNAGGNNGWRITGTNAICDTNASVKNRNLNSTFSLISGKDYKLTIDILQSEDNIQILIGSTTLSATLPTGTNLAYEYLISSADHTGGLFQIYGGSSDLQEIDNIVLQELKHDATNLMLNAGAYQSANPLITSTKSMEFDGSDDYLQLSEPFSHTNHTITGWFKLDVISGITTLFDSRDSADDGLIAYIDGTGRVSYRIGDGSGSTIHSSSLNANKWYNFACTYDGTTQTIYINGVDVVNTTVTKTISTTTNATIGKVSYTNALYFDGKITEVGAYNRALTPLEVASLYNQGMPTNLLVNRNNYQSGNPTVFNTKQVDFDGTDDYMVVTNNYGSFTGSVSFWINRDTNIGSFPYVLDFREFGDDTNGTGYIHFQSSDNTIVGSTGTRYVDGVAGTQVPTDSSWHHVVITGISLNITANILFGVRSSNQFFLNGKLSQVGLFNSTLTANEVSSLYNHGLPIDLTTDQAAYESSSNLVGYWRMGSGTLDSYPLIADQTNATLGSELVTSWSNNDFPSFASSGSDITQMVSSGSGNNCYSSTTITSGKTYKLQFTSSQAITCQIRISPNTSLTSATVVLSSLSSGSNEVYFTAPSNYAYIGFYAPNSFTDTQISSFTLKKVNGNPAIMTNQTSSDIEQGSPYANIVQNGTFDTNVDNWSGDSGATVVWQSDSTALVTTTADNNFAARQDGILTSGVTYKTTFRFKPNNTGEFRVRLGGSSYQFISSDFVVDSWNEVEFTATADGSNIEIGSYSGNITNFYLDNVTVTEVNTGLQGYWKMGDGTNDEYPVIYDQTNPTLSAELVTNGDFATTSNWSENGGANAWSISGGKANCVAFASLRYFEQSNALETSGAGKTYKVVFTVSNYIQGILRVNVGGYQVGAAVTSNGTHTQYIAVTNASSNKSVYLQSNANTILSVDNISVKKVQGNFATMTNMVEGNITNQFPLTKIRNYYRMGDGILDGYPIIQDQTSPNLAHIPTTNLVTSSEDFTGSFWSRFGTIDASSLVLAPDGTVSAQKLVRSAGTYNIIRPAVNITGTYYAQSVFVKNIDADNFYLRLEKSGSAEFGYYNFASDTISDTDIKVEHLANDWIRLSTNVPDNDFKSFGIGDNEFDSTELNHSVYVWGAQIEAQGQATPYIKSDGIAAVRKATTTNLFLYSEDFSQSFWTKSSVTLTTGFVSPDGTNNAYKLVSTGADGLMHNNYTVSSGTTYTISVYLKTVSGTLDTTLSLGSPGFPQNVGAGGRYKNITVTNEWKRYSLTSTADASAVSGMGFGGFSGFSTGEEVLIWGMQLEEQTQAETYAKTTGLPVTIDLFTENNYGTMTNMSASDIIEDTPNN